MRYAFVVKRRDDIKPLLTFAGDGAGTPPSSDVCVIALTAPYVNMARTWQNETEFGVAQEQRRGNRERRSREGLGVATTTSHRQKWPGEREDGMENRNHAG